MQREVLFVKGKVNIMQINLQIQRNIITLGFCKKNFVIYLFKAYGLISVRLWNFKDGGS